MLRFLMFATVYTANNFKGKQDYNLANGKFSRGNRIRNIFTHPLDAISIFLFLK